MTAQLWDQCRLGGAALTEGKTGVSSDEGGRFVLTDIPAGTTCCALPISVSPNSFWPMFQSTVNRLELVMSDEVIFIDQSVVSASRRQEKMLDAPASVSVIDAEDIRTQPVSTVAEHIRDLPAVDFAQTGLAQANVVARGFNIFSGAMLTLADNRIARVPSRKSWYLQLYRDQ